MTAKNKDASPTKIAIVTGGSRGLGRNTVLSLAKQGVHSILTYNSNRTEADKVVAEAAKGGATAVALQLDMADVGAFDRFVASVRTALVGLGTERFDYLVNNAAISHHVDFVETPEADLDQIYRVNFKGPFYLTQKLLPVMNDGGRIVNLSTCSTRFTVAGSASYAAMKGALEVLTLYLATELGPRRITVNAVAPGAIATDFSGGVVRDNPEINKLVANMTALGRAGQPDDVGPMIASLLSDSNRWINGQRIEVSGGTFLGPVMSSLIAETGSR
jgi:NAD(P)-dependent dehydrogenase (short-subunit alcohol dehydrogenase family)